jgi:NADH-quinone oxidoreductase subunit J
MNEKNDAFKGVVLLIFLWLLIVSLTSAAWYTGIKTFEGTAKAVGKTLFTYYVFPFEIVAVLLLAAMVGAIYLAKKEAAG